MAIKIVNQSKNRKSSIELLRLILMFFIVVHHGITHGLGLDSFASWSNQILLIGGKNVDLMLMVNAFCICAVNCFVLISGYFGIKTTKRKFKTLLFTLVFYTILLNIVPLICQGQYKDAVKSMLFLSHSPYWFIIDYLFLMALAPLLNYSELLTRSHSRFINCVLIIISCYFGFIWGNTVNNSGYTLMQFIMLYCIGRYFKTYGYSVNTRVSTFLYFFPALINGLIMIFCYSHGRIELCWKASYYNNPLIILSAIGLFFAFNNLNFYSNIINKASASAIAIYLIQSSSWISDIFYTTISSIWRECYNNSADMLHSGGGILLSISALSLLIIIGAIIFDQIRKYLCDMLVR